MTTSIKDLICSAGTVGTDGVGAVIDPNFVYDKTKYVERIVDNSNVEIYSQKTSGATARTWHSAIYYNNGTNNLMVIFGGYEYDNSSFFNDVWEYNIDTDTWTEKTAGATARAWHSAIYYNNGTNNLMVIFGGEDDNDNFLNDVWEYNLDTDTWTEKTAGATIRSHHSAIYYNNGTNNLMIILGGIDDDSNTLDSVCEYNLDTDTWTEKTSNPITRYRTSAIYYNNGTNNLMVIFGGVNLDSGMFGLNDVWEYNLDTDTWTEKIQNIKPQIMLDNSAIYYNNGINNLVVIPDGRSTDNNITINIWEYNLDSNIWLQKSSFPYRIWNSVIYYNNGTNNLMVIFGGKDNNSNMLNDVWEYNLDITLILKILYPIIG